MRAPTPTAAAELCTPVKEELKQHLINYQKRLISSIKSYLEEKRQVLKLQDEKLPRSLKLFVNQLYSNFQDVSSKLNTEILKEQLNSNLNNLNNTATHLIKAKKLFLNLRSEKILSLNKLLESLSYKSVINRGYSVIRNSKNKIL